jgi:hypothetical protein
MARPRTAPAAGVQQEDTRLHRLFGLLALAAAGFGAWVLFTSPDPAALDATAHAGSEARGVTGGWAMGLLMGLVLAWLATIDWRDLPHRLGAWLRLQRRRLTLIVIGGLCASVLLLF